MTMQTHVHPRDGDGFSALGTPDTFAVTVSRGGGGFGAATVTIFMTPEQAALVVERFSAALREREVLAEVRAKIAAGGGA